MQRNARSDCQLKKDCMKGIVPALTVIVFVFIFAGCSKEDTQSEPALYGTWIKGSQAGDTLRFMRKNNMNIMLQNESFNAGMPVYTEKEYRFRNGKLSIKLYSPVSQDYYPIDSFTWTQAGSEFTIQGIQLFMFMSSTMTWFTYLKL
jgi:hypothetical protein